jgi:hypothetical protein
MSETTNAPAIDKSTWGPGPWQSEPDRVDFVHAGFACFVRRREDHGNFCGYVGVPHEHPLYGKPYDDAEVAPLERRRLNQRIPRVRPRRAAFESFRFRLAHSRNHARRQIERVRAVETQPPHVVYRDLPYVRAECERLAEQLAGLG